MRMPLQIAALIVASAAFALAAAAAPDPAQEPTADIQFRDAYRLVQLADSAYEKDDWARAREFYTEALNIYGMMRRKFPDWQVGVVEFRIRYCTRRLELLPAPPPAETNSAARARITDALLPPTLDERPDQAAAQAAKALDNLIEASRRHLVAGNVRPARDSLMAALKISPDHPTIRLLLGFAQCQLGQFEDAATILDNLIEDDPKNAQAYLYRGTARIGLGRTGDAIADMQQSVKLNPAFQEAHYNLAQALLMKSPPDVAGAQKSYRKAIELGGAADPDLEARIMAATKPK